MSGGRFAVPALHGRRNPTRHRRLQRLYARVGFLAALLALLAVAAPI
ncbi:MAG TPA: hypothetical protein VM434_01080 [Beijerinckiaceae bacterium]|nr:hypothetical protein [Beijerinckiaceae bacterium]